MNNIKSFGYVALVNILFSVGSVSTFADRDVKQEILILINIDV